MVGGCFVGLVLHLLLRLGRSFAIGIGVGEALYVAALGRGTWGRFVISWDMWSLWKGVHALKVVLLCVAEVCAMNGGRW